MTGSYKNVVCIPLLSIQCRSASVYAKHLSLWLKESMKMCSLCRTVKTCSLVELFLNGRFEWNTFFISPFTLQYARIFLIQSTKSSEFFSVLFGSFSILGRIAIFWSGYCDLTRQKFTIVLLENNAKLVRTCSTCSFLLSWKNLSLFSSLTDELRKGCVGARKV